MKIVYLLVGLLVGGASGFLLTKSTSPTQTAIAKQNEIDTVHKEKSWRWPDSLDAVEAASESHRLVYEDSNVRILQVLLAANKTEAMHTHKWKSIMWFAQATPMTYYKYAPVNSIYSVSDSFVIPQMPPEVLNRGELVEAEELYAVRNSGSKEGMAYRVEFKKDFR